MAGEAAHVRLIDDGARAGAAERRVAFPIVGAGIDDDALHGGARGIAGEARGFAAVAGGDDDAAAVGIEEELTGIEAQSGGGVEGAVDAVAVELAGAGAGDEGVPVVVGAIGGGGNANDARGEGIVFAIEEKELDGGGEAREDAEVDAIGLHGCAQRGAASRSPGSGDGYGLRMFEEVRGHESAPKEIAP